MISPYESPGGDDVEEYTWPEEDTQIEDGSAEYLPSQPLKTEVFPETENGEAIFNEDGLENDEPRVDHSRKQSAGNSFRKKLDMDTGQYYYVNIETEETFWDKPLPGKIPDLELPPERKKELERQRKARQKEERIAKKERQRLIAKRQADHKMKLYLKDKEEKEKEVKRRAQLWEDALYHARKTGEVNMSWRGLGQVDPVLYGFEARFSLPVVGLHLIGHEMTYLPETAPEKLRSLRSLSLASNRLAALPDSLTLLTELRELNLLRNRLERLPEGIGALGNLRTLLVASNRLAEVPASLGRLRKLDRLVLDSNALAKLPEELGALRVHTFSANQNRLDELPHCVKDMPNLTALSCNQNRLKYLPHDIGGAAKLTKLHACGNRLNQLPDSICRLVALEQLWLDFNCLAAVPMQFHRLERLQVLKLEGNPGMVYPTPEKIAEGVAAVLEWARKRLDNRVFRRRQTLVLAFLDLLKQVAEEGLGRPQVFEAGVEFQEERWYQFVPEYFWGEMLPAVEKVWAAGAHARGRVTGFQYERQEVEQVLGDYKDPRGRVALARRMKFRRCGCLDPADRRRRRVCVPPAAGWMCERPCLLVKEHVLLERELVERQRQAREKQYVLDAQDIARGLVEDFAASAKGNQLYTERAVRQAEVLMEAQRQGRFATEGEALLAKRKADVEARFAKKRKKLERARVQRLTDLKQMRADLERQLEGQVGWAREQTTKRLDKLLDDMEHLPEELALAELEGELAQALGGAEAGKARRRLRRRGLFRRALDQLRGERDDLVEQLRIDLVRQDAERDAAVAKREAERSNRVFRSIMAMWLGAGMREHFNQWRGYVRDRHRQRKRDLREQRRQQRRKYEAQMASVRLAEWRAAKFDRYVDAYTDATYWVQRESGEHRDSEPLVEKFLPPGFVVPERPPAMDEVTSSSSDSNALTEDLTTSTEESTGSEEEETSSEEEEDAEESQQRDASSLLKESMSATVDTVASGSTVALSRGKRYLGDKVNQAQGRVAKKQEEEEEDKKEDGDDGGLLATLSSSEDAGSGSDADDESDDGTAAAERRREARRRRQREAEAALAAAASPVPGGGGAQAVGAAGQALVVREQHALAAPSPAEQLALTKQHLGRAVAEFRGLAEDKMVDEAEAARERMRARRRRGVAAQRAQLQANKDARELARLEVMRGNVAVKDPAKLKAMNKRRKSVEVYKEVGYDPTKQYTNEELDQMAKMALKLNKQAGITENGGVGSLVGENGYVYGRNKSDAKKKEAEAAAKQRAAAGKKGGRLPRLLGR